MKNQEITVKELKEILSYSIIRDDSNKLITFFLTLLTYTPQYPQNIIINSQSSSGKTYLAKNILRFFPIEDVVTLAGSSPRAFFHEQGSYDKESNTNTLDFTNKILFFLDQPSPELLSTLRSLASHDAEVLQHKIVDKNDVGGNRTKTVKLVGFPTIVYCTASKYIDSQELTRSTIICPSIDHIKNMEAIDLKLRQATDEIPDDQKYQDKYELLRQHILNIKQLDIKKIIVPFQYSKATSFNRIFNSKFLPKDQREIDKILGLARGIALFNYKNREVNYLSNTIKTSNEDVETAIDLWLNIQDFQSDTVPATSILVYKIAILPLWEKCDKNIGISKSSISRKYYEETGEPLRGYLLYRSALQDLSDIGKIEMRTGADGREKMIFVLT